MFYRMFRKILCSDSSPIEVFTSMQAIVWGLWLTLPLNTFSASTVYSVMESIAPEYVWGIYLILMGICQLVCIHFKWTLPRRVIAVIVLFTWVCIDVGFWLSNSTSGASATYLVYVAMSAWSVASLSVQDKINCGNR